MKRTNAHAQTENRRRDNSDKIQNQKSTTSLWNHLQTLLPVVDLTSPDFDLPEESVSVPPVFDQIARTLFQSKRGHLVLTGNRGVGKTSAIYELARLVRQKCFPHLLNIQVLLIDVSNIGQEDSRACLEAIFAAIGDLEDHCQLLLCLDGMAAILKRAHGGTNKPMLRSLLSRKGLRIIGTMSPSDYLEQMGNDSQMLELFSRIEISEPRDDELHEIVAETARKLSDEFALEIPAQVVDRIAPLTSTFLLSESQPAKSIEVLRQACEEAEYKRTRKLSEQASITVDDLIRVVSERTGIPAETINGSGNVCDFEQALSDVVVGQELAVREVASELRLISAGLTEPTKPATVLMFAGMTGVGKTEMAKRVAELHSSTRRLQIYSMGNFTEAHSVSGIIGVPPGYVGHEDGGRLINELRADPYSVFLLDEAEKCHPNVWKPFLNLFDEGWIVDQRGVKAFADRAIFILTTNAGDRNISQLVRSGKSVEEVSQNVRQALSRVRHERSSQPVFPPQFLSRMKRIIVFNPLEEAAMVSIAQRAARRLTARWKTIRNKTISLSEELVSQIGRRAHELNEQSNGQEGGRIVQKQFSEVVEDEVYRKSVEFRELYDRCTEIQVTPLGQMTAGNALRADVMFVV